MLILSRHLVIAGTLTVALNSTHAAQAQKDYPVNPVPFTKTRFDDGFWRPRLETNRKVTIPYDFKKCEETGRISNFAKAGGLMKGKFEGIRFNDSDVFKIVEGAAYSLALHPDPKLERYLDDLIVKMVAAQEDDGYLYTTRTIDPKRPASGAGKTRWSNTQVAHELYNVGHMYEAAVAFYRATGKRSLLDVAIKNADLIDRVFGPNKKYDAPGHQEIEIGLARLYRVTGEAKYLKLAKFFLDERGQRDRRKIYGAYCQDHEPVVEQREAVGHAVRAGYMYAGMADVAALTGDRAYVEAIDRIWDNVASRKLYLTGGIGARHKGEAFGDDYELPNKTAYNETCAAIANAMWNHRLFLLHGDAKYLDVLERVLYNGFLSGVSLTGDAFFYPNPLECDATYKFNHGAVVRQPWFGCSCCPSNVVRFLPSLLGYAYAHRDDVVYVNLYVAGSATVELKNNTVRLEQGTRYPWDGAIKITVDPKRPAAFALHLRIPGWSGGQPVPSDLYRYLNEGAEEATLKVNGKAAALDLDKGFARIRRNWKTGDVIELNLPMPIRRVLCHQKVEDNRGKVALERGPIVYCAEGVDNGGRVFSLILSDDAVLETRWEKDLLGGVTTIRGEVPAVHRSKDGGSVAKVKQGFVAIPYCAWAHRGDSKMAVWLARDPSIAKPAPAPTIASTSRVSASHVWSRDSTSALNDQAQPESSIDHSIPRFTWWNHKGTTEWVQYDFGKARQVQCVEVYWFDDTGRGQCRVPRSWKLLCRDGDTWKPAQSTGAYGVEKDKYNEVTFTPVTTTGLRLLVTLRPGFSGGILEWRVR